MPTQNFSALAVTTLPEDAIVYFGYYKSKLPGPKDDEIKKLVEVYKAASADERLTIANGLTGQQANWLDTYGFRMSMLSVRQGSAELLQSGIVALLMTMKVKDWREGILSSSVLYRAAELLHVGDAAFREAARYAPDAASAELLLGYLKRSGDDKTVEAMGFRELTGKNGLIFVFGDQPVPEGLQ